jgi:hypothetical protein
MKDHGVTPIDWTAVAAELQRDWRLPTAQDLAWVFYDHYRSYGLLMDSFESKTANVTRKASWQAIERRELLGSKGAN